MNNFRNTLSNNSCLHWGGIDFQLPHNVWLNCEYPSTSRKEISSFTDGNSRSQRPPCTRGGAAWCHLRSLIREAIVFVINFYSNQKLLFIILIKIFDLIFFFLLFLFLLDNLQLYRKNKSKKMYSKYLSHLATETHFFWTKLCSTNILCKEMKNNLWFA